MPSRGTAIGEGIGRPSVPGADDAAGHPRARVPTFRVGGRRLGPDDFREPHRLERPRFLPIRCGAPGWRASAAVAGLAIALLATWLPDYLTWPWWPDADAWAFMGEGWDAGLRPYRDVSCFNFPGPIYLCWLLGKTCGWGRRAVLCGRCGPPDRPGGPAGGVEPAGIRLAWPGLVGWLAAVAMDCGLDYSLVAQRDWQGPLLAAASVLVLQGWTGRAATMASAALMACAFVVRPHVVLFGAADPRGDRVRRRDEGRGDPSGDRVGRRVRGPSAVLAFSPLILQGLIPDFVRGIRQASYGSGYGGVTPASIATGVAGRGGLLPPGPGGDGFSRLGGPRRRVERWRPWRDWGPRGWRFGAPAEEVAAAVARRVLVTVIFYAPLHPKPHGYPCCPCAWSGRSPGTHWPARCWSGFAAIGRSCGSRSAWGSSPWRCRACPRIAGRLSL